MPAGVYASQSRDDFSADDVEHYFNYMGMLATEVRPCSYGGVWHGVLLAIVKSGLHHWTGRSYVKRDASTFLSNVQGTYDRLNQLLERTLPSSLHFSAPLQIYPVTNDAPCLEARNSLVSLKFELWIVPSMLFAFRREFGDSSQKGT